MLNKLGKPRLRVINFDHILGDIIHIMHDIDHSDEGQPTPMNNLT